MRLVLDSVLILYGIDVFGRHVLVLLGLLAARDCYCV